MLSTQKALFSVLILLCFFTSAFTQSHWEVGTSIATSWVRSTKYQHEPATRSFIPQVNFGRVIATNKSSWKLMVGTGWQHIREEGKDFYYKGINGISEKLRIDNLYLSGGLEYSFYNNRKYRVLFGANLFLGIPMKAEYKMENLASPLENVLPLAINATGGAECLYGQSFYTGLMTDLSPKSQMKFRLGMGTQSQRLAWGLPNNSLFLYNAGNSTRIMIGGFWLADFEVVYRI